MLNSATQLPFLSPQFKKTCSSLGQVYEDHLPATLALFSAPRKERLKFGPSISHVWLAGTWVAPVSSGDGEQWGSPGCTLATLGREASRPASSRSCALGVLPGAFQAPQPLLSRPPPQDWRLPASPGHLNAGGCGRWWPWELQGTRGPQGLGAGQERATCLPQQLGCARQDGARLSARARPSPTAPCWR